jgi:hypothetical protein
MDNSPSPLSTKPLSSGVIDKTTNATINGEVQKLMRMTQAEREKIYSEQEAKVEKVVKEYCDPNSPKGFIWKKEYQKKWSAKVDMKHEVFAFNKVRSFQKNQIETVVG